MGSGMRFRVSGVPDAAALGRFKRALSGSMNRCVAALHFDVAISAACERILLLARHLLDQAASMACALLATVALTLAAMC